MSYDIGTATIYEGLAADITENASSGILWVRSLWNALDSLDPSTAVPITTLTTPDCKFIMNGAPPRSPSDIEAMFVQRASFLSDFGHTRYPMRIVDVDLGEGKRLVNVQGTSHSMIKTDPEKTELRVAEMTVAELIMADGKVLATTIGSYLDPTPVAQKMQEVASLKQSSIG